MGEKEGECSRAQKSLWVKNQERVNADEETVSLYLLNYVSCCFSVSIVNYCMLSWTSFLNNITE